MKTKPPFDGEIHAVSAKNMPDLNSPKREPGWFLGNPAPQTTPTRDEAVPTGWRYSINYGPDGEENFANVYAADGQFVGNLRTHHAIAICEKLASAPAPASGVDAVAGGVDLVAAINHAESELSQHIEKYHDYEDDTPERASLRDIQHHLMGSLIADDGEFLSPAAPPFNRSPDMTAIDERALGAAIIEGSNMAGERLVTQIVTAYLKALGDEGWVLVPKEPTTKMLAAGQTAWLADPCRKSSTLYRAMLAAAGGTE